ncbi:cell division protein SepF [Spirillospora sp. NPDC047279]|uniref:cell division protein SepF n=1 Tax=Spirillospora sp. NPDC047279 TaxID=3155478 RepID=UPI003404F0F6
MVKTLHPKSYNEVYYVGHFFRQGIPVIMDLTALTDTEALPLVDFAAGLIVGRGGAMERVTPKVFLLTPSIQPALP